MLINLNYNGMELSLCNIYVPNDHADQLRFIEELNNYLIDKSELTSLTYILFLRYHKQINTSNTLKRKIKRLTLCG